MIGRFCSVERGAFVVAHRGASDEAPENTLPAFERALEVGCRVLECDVHLSSDDVIVVIHDRTLRRTTGTPGAVASMSWRQIAAADAGFPRRFGRRFRATRVPRLEELLELARGRAELMVEIKADAGAPLQRMVSRVLDVTADLDMAADVGVISMSADVVRGVRELSPRTTTGLVFRRRRLRGLVREAVASSADFMIAATGRLLADPRLCQQARASGLRVGAYVVDTPAELGTLLEQGVESFACDDPGAMLPELEARAA